MNRYITNLKAFLSEKSPHYGCEDANSLMEMLYYFYTEANPIEGGTIKLRFKELDAILSKLSVCENNAVFALVCGLCENCQQKAFLEGIHVGLRLFGELSDMA